MRKVVRIASCFVSSDMKDQINAEEFQEMLTKEPDVWNLTGEKHWIEHQSLGLSYQCPMIWPPAGREETVPEYLKRIPDELPSYYLLMVQLGAAALGYAEEGEFIAHKAIKKYMKRQKRGKAQIGYLKTRGKSKAGSRIRLANTERFFEEINERVRDWEELYDSPEYIFISATPNVWGMMYQAEPSPPFRKKDPRIRRVPFDVGVPDFRQLQNIGGKLSMAIRR